MDDSLKRAKLTAVQQALACLHPQPCASELVGDESTPSALLIENPTGTKVGRHDTLLSRAHASHLTSPFSLRVSESGWLLSLSTQQCEDGIYLPAGLDDFAEVATQVVKVINDRVWQDVSTPLWRETWWDGTDWAHWRTGLVRDALAPVVDVHFQQYEKIAPAGNMPDSRDWKPIPLIIFVETDSSLHLVAPDAWGTQDVPAGSWVYENPKLGVFKILDSNISTPASAVAQEALRVDDAVVQQMRELMGIAPGQMLGVRPRSSDGLEVAEAWQGSMCDLVNQMKQVLNQAGMNATVFGEETLGPVFGLRLGVGFLGNHTLIPCNTDIADNYGSGVTKLLKNGKPGATRQHLSQTFGQWLLKLPSPDYHDYMVTGVRLEDFDGVVEFLKQLPNF